MRYVQMVGSTDRDANDGGGRRAVQAQAAGGAADADRRWWIDGYAALSASAGDGWVLGAHVAGVGRRGKRIVSDFTPLYIVVRNPKPRWLPQWLRVRLGECYMGINVVPYWVTNPAAARQFESPAIAQCYLQRTDGQRFNGMENAVVQPSPLRQAITTGEQP